MTDSTPASGPVLGRLGSADGKGIVRIEHRHDAGIADIWAALTSPERLASWLGEVTGDLRLGGDYRFHFLASGAEGTGRIVECEAPRRFVVLTRALDEPDEQIIELILTADGDQATTLVLEQRGLPLDGLATFGAGIQVHVEDLAAHVAGHERCDSDARMGELVPLYQELPVSAG